MPKEISFMATTWHSSIFSLCDIREIHSSEECIFELYLWSSHCQHDHTIYHMTNRYSISHCNQQQDGISLEFLVRIIEMRCSHIIENRYSQKPDENK